MVSDREFFGITWTFGISKSRSVFESVQIHPDGRITGLPAEYGIRWSMNAGILCFHTRDDAVRIGFRDHFILGPHRLHRGWVPMAHPLYKGPEESYDLYPDGEDIGFLPRWTAYGFRNHPARERYDIGAHSYGAPMILQGGDAHLKIGRFTSIGPHVTIGLGYHRMDCVSTYPFATILHMGGDWPSAEGMKDHTHNGDIHIGSDVWIGANAFIGSGVTIGDGAVIGASSVVTRDVPPYAIVGGNTARILRYRFSEAQISALLKIQWWNWPVAIVSANVHRIGDSDIDGFLRFAKAWALTEGGFDQGL